MKYSIIAVLAVAITLILGSVLPAAAQQDDAVWIQIEAQPSLTQAQDRARAYGAELPDVSGFSLGNGWYGIVLGPYTRADADHVLNVYRSEGSIPRDSYIAFSTSFRQQFWPIGENVLKRGVIEPPVAAALPDPAPDKPAAILTPLGASDETPAEARRSERNLTRPEREELQTALKWGGFYSAAIDGAFGRGTRSSMSDWQFAHGFEATGILTTRQRQTLLDQYNAVLKGMDLELVQDMATGIEMKIPSGVVAFDKYEPPFAQFSPTGDIAAQVLLISQEGNQDTLFGLYDIMQTLEIVPLNGPRERTKDGFRLIGENGHMISQTQAQLVDGKIKGFTLIWPAGDEDRRRRVLGEMQKSFARIDGVLDAAASTNADQHIDLVSGLEIRKPTTSRSGFYIDASGTIVTTSDAVHSCTRITVDNEHEAELVSSDAASGIAVLRPIEKLSPLKVALFSEATPRLQSQIALGGYSFEGILGAPSVTFGKLVDIRGLRGEEQLKRLALTPLPGDVGGPVLDNSGNLLGMLLPKPASGPQLPDDVSFAVDGARIRSFLDSAGLSATVASAKDPMATEDLRARASAMTVLVSCWN